MSAWDVEERDGIIIAAHDNPPMNYFIGESAAELAETLPRWREDDVRVVVITGATPGKYIATTLDKPVIAAMIGDTGVK